MTTEQVMDVFYEFFLLSIKIGGPILVLSMVIGIVIAIFQAATQIHEQTVTFVPKLFITGAILLIFGSTMLTMLQEYTRQVFSMM